MGKSEHAPDMALEEVIVRAFFLPGPRDRFLYLLPRPKRRGDALSSLAHSCPIAPRYLSRIPTGVGFQTLLESYGAPDTCYAISADSSLDGRHLDLEEALAASSDSGTLLACLPSTLCYFENEDDRFIGRKPLPSR